MKVEILIHYQGGQIYLDYEQVVLSAQAKDIGVDDQVQAIKNNVRAIEQYWSSEDK